MVTAPFFVFGCSIAQKQWVGKDKSGFFHGFLMFIFTGVKLKVIAANVLITFEKNTRKKGKSMVP
jgi:uncharacterized protein YfiM (DUF2279 family)